MNKGKFILEWDSLKIIQGQVEFLKETDECKDKSYMKMNIHGGWKAEVENFGWRYLSGSKFFMAHTGRNLLGHILPKTDCTFRIYRRGKGFAINNAHHDSPTWNEWYFITPSKLALEMAA
jgi:hypothetical protein